MKHKLLKTVLVLICISAMILGSVMIVQAEDMQEVIIGEHTVTIQPQTQNAGYVYVNAQVPNGWGGEIQVNFHSQSTGKDHSISMSYIENEYHSGLWLPAGTYQVSPELPQEDGLCRLQLQDPSQKVLQVRSGEDLYLNILAAEIPEGSTATEETSAAVIPPKNQEDYQDLPTAEAEAQSESTVSVEIVGSEEEPESENLLIRIIRSLSAILIIVILVLTVVLWIRNRSNENSH